MEKTFREVIRDIKENEVWESNLRRIELVNGTVQISRVDGNGFHDFIILFSDITMYKLKS